MMYDPLRFMQLVHKSGFGVDPETYKPFGLNGHHGVDLVAGIGTPVYAPEDGVIQVSANGTIDQYTGRNVAGQTIVLVSNKHEHWFLHLSKRMLTQGDKVKAGQLIGLTGNTGFVTGPHLHWGVRPLKPDLNNGYRGFIDPMIILKEDEMAKPTRDEWQEIHQLAFQGERASEKTIDYLMSLKDLGAGLRWIHQGGTWVDRVKQLKSKAGLTSEQLKGLEALNVLKEVLK